MYRQPITQKTPEQIRKDKIAVQHALEKPEHTQRIHAEQQALKITPKKSAKPNRHGIFQPLSTQSQQTLSVEVAPKKNNGDNAQRIFTQRDHRADAAAKKAQRKANDEARAEKYSPK